MEKRVTFRLSDKLLDLLNKDAVKSDIKLSEQIRRVVESNYGVVVQGVENKGVVGNFDKTKKGDKHSDVGQKDDKITVKHLSDNYDVSEPESKKKWDIDSMRKKLEGKPKEVRFDKLGSKRVE